MKKTITEYESAEKTQSLIQCEGCDTRWKKRGDEGNVLLLDGFIASHRRYSSRHSPRMKKLGDSWYSGDKISLEAQEVADYCDDCLDELFDIPLYVKVEESDFYVDEKERVEYLCDFCEDNMGEEADHTVTKNARIVSRKGAGPLVYSSSERDVMETVVYETDKRVDNDHHYTKVNSVFDEQFECCEGCAARIFKLESDEDVDYDATPSFLSSFASSLKSFVFGM